MQAKSENCLAIKKNKIITWKKDFNMKNNEKQYITQKSKYLAPYSSEFQFLASVVSNPLQYIS